MFIYVLLMNVESSVIALVYSMCDSIRLYAVSDGSELRSEASEFLYDICVRLEAESAEN